MLESMMESEKGIKITNALKVKIEQYRKEDYDKDIKFGVSAKTHSHIVKKLLYNIFFRPHDTEGFSANNENEFLECRDIRLRMKELIEEASESEIVEEDSLSVNTSDADRIESEYYIDDAINEKAQEINQKFEKRIKHMTQTIYERIKNSPKTLEKKIFDKRKYDEAFDEDYELIMKRTKQQQEYLEEYRINKPRIKYLKASKRDNGLKTTSRENRFEVQLDNDRRRRYNQFKEQADDIIKSDELAINQIPLIRNKEFIFDTIEGNEIEIQPKRILSEDVYSSSDDDEE